MIIPTSTLYVNDKNSQTRRSVETLGLSGNVYSFDCSYSFMNILNNACNVNVTYGMEL